MLSQINTNSLFFRIFTIVGIILVLLIPVSMIRSLIQEREMRSESVREQIAQQWGGKQNLEGPFLVIPYRLIETKNENASSGKIVILPEELYVSGSLKSEKRKRGIFETVLYNANLNFKGKFILPDLENLTSRLPRKGKVRLGHAYFSVSIPHTRGIRKTSDLKWNSNNTQFRPGSGFETIRGIQSSVNISGGNSFSFSFSINLLGNELISFIPAGKKNEVKISSDWNSPSFIGSYLPDSREVSEDGFRATWKVSSLGRSYDQILLDPFASGYLPVQESSFGVKLITALDHYQKTERAIKYAILFLGLTFTAFFLFEIFNRYKIHPIQYILIGLSMIMFYALFLSLTEQMPFIIAYVIATLATVGLITYYSAFVLRNKKRAYGMGTFLFALYTYLYVVLKSEDHALIMGTAGLFTILGIVMFITRNLDWYAIRAINEPTRESE